MGQNHWSIYVLYVPYYRSVGKTETVAGEWFRVWQAVSSLWRSSGVITLLSILLKTDLSLCNSILSWFHFKLSKSNFKLIWFFVFVFQDMLVGYDCMSLSVMSLFPGHFAPCVAKIGQMGARLSQSDQSLLYFCNVHPWDHVCRVSINYIAL